MDLNEDALHLTGKPSRLIKLRKAIERMRADKQSATHRLASSEYSLQTHK
jgi:hypothetical protein